MDVICVGMLAMYQNSAYLVHVESQGTGFTHVEKHWSYFTLPAEVFLVCSDFKYFSTTQSSLSEAG